MVTECSQEMEKYESVSDLWSETSPSEAVREVQSVVCSNGSESELTLSFFSGGMDELGHPSADQLFT